MKRILCYGDSNTYGFDPTQCDQTTGKAGRYDESVRWTMLLNSMLGKEYMVIEQGLNGRTTVFPDPLAPCRNGQEYLETTLLSNDPLDLFIIMLGTNDMKAMFSASAEVIAWGLERLVNQVKQFASGSLNPKMRILVVSPIRVSASKEGKFFYDFDERSIEKSKQIAGYYASICERYGVEFMDAAEYASPGPTDGIHLEIDGHAKLAAAVCERVKALI